MSGVSPKTREAIYAAVMRGMDTSDADALPDAVATLFLDTRSEDPEVRKDALHRVMSLATIGMIYEQGYLS